MENKENIVKPVENEINEPVMEAPEEINWEAKCELLTHNLESAYAKIRQLEKQMNDRLVKERSADMLISQAASVFSNTIMLAIKNKEN